MNVARLLFLALVPMFLLGCGGGGDGSREAGSDRVAVTIWPLADVTRQLLPEAIEVVTLLPPGQSPHGFELTPRQVQALSGADIMIAVGLSIDPWADEAVERVGADVTRWHMAEALAIRDDSDHAGHDHAHHDHDHGHHHHGSVNPHLWLDPVLMRLAVDDLHVRLMAEYPEHADAIAERTAAYIEQLESLDTTYRSRLQGIEEPRIATFHDAFDLLAERYGIEVVATLMPFDPVGEVQLARIEAVREAVRQHELTALFIEPQFSDTAAKIIRENTGVELILLDPIGDPNEPQRDSYLKMMQFNLDQLVRGLTGS